MLGISVSASLLLTAGLVAGQRARICPLSGSSLTKTPPGLPSIRAAKDAYHIRLKEISPTSSTTSLKWLELSARELLGQ